MRNDAAALAAQQAATPLLLPTPNPYQRGVLEREREYERR